MNELIQNIRQWGKDRNIIGSNAKATVKTQFEKLREEFTELEAAYDEIKDRKGKMVNGTFEKSVRSKL